MSQTCETLKHAVLELSLLKHELSQVQTVYVDVVSEVFVNDEDMHLRILSLQKVSSSYVQLSGNMFTHRYVYQIFLRVYVYEYICIHIYIVSIYTYAYKRMSRQCFFPSTSRFLFLRRVRAVYSCVRVRVDIYFVGYTHTLTSIQPETNTRLCMACNHLTKLDVWFYGVSRR